MAEKRNDGTDLETLVSIVEQVFIPHGFSVERRKLVFNDDGVQIAELDIVVSGKVGSVQYSILIECRDRPSEGSASVGWIEQLVGRRNRLKMDTVVAVSTTEFSPGAIDYASKENIRLRDFTRLDYADVHSWLPLFSPTVNRTANMVGCSIFLGKLPKQNDDPTPFTAGGSHIHIEMEERCYLHRSTGHLETITEVWSRLVNEEKNIFDNLPPDGGPVRRQVDASTSFLESYVVKLEQQTFHISKLTFDADIEEKPSGMALVGVAEYGGSDTEQRTVAHWKGEEKGFLNDLYLVLIKNAPDPS